MKTRAAYAATLTAAALALAITNPTDAHSVTTGPVVSGTGWKIAAPGITHLDTQPWTIAFHDTASRTKLTPYLRNTAAELTSYTGVKFTVTTKIVPVSRGKCVTGHAVGLKHPDTCPTNAAGLRPLMCADTYKDLRTRRYSPYEATAFRHLVLNRAYYPTTLAVTR